MSIHTILGAGGVIADGLARELIAQGHPVRRVSRQPHPWLGTQTVQADLTDPAQTLQAIEGSSIVYLCVGLKYDYSVWRHDWPPIINNTLDACKRTEARLIFFDNVYMYGKTEGPMTEDNSYDPVSRKGDLRARLATQIMSEVRKGNIIATIARAADFYGPGSDKTGMANILVFQRLIKGRIAQWLVNGNARHSFTYTPDAVRALYLLGQDENSWNQVWHLPTASQPLTGQQLAALAAGEFGQKAACKILPKWQIRIGGLFDKVTAEIYEMLYQYESDYIFDSSKFEKAFNYQPVSYGEGIKATANVYKNDTGR